MDECRAKLNIAREALVRITGYPVHSEMVGSALNLQDLAREALDKINTKGEQT